MIYDTSVAVSWYVDLPWSGDARTIVAGDPVPEAPFLIMAEAANAFWRLVRANQMTDDAAHSALDHLDSALVLTDSRSIRRNALSYALLNNHPVYDCVFLALAKEKQDELLTADRRLAAMAQRADIAVTLLGP